MGDACYHLNTSSRVGLRNNCGEIVEVQGGHIVRATGRKDRHSKVCTAKGPRDRRVRLSAHTAIQFYDVQDRLGYDRPSKAVDWLIKKAKAAIDELAELPPWHPTSGSMALQQKSTQPQRHFEVAVTISAGPSSKRAISMLGIEDEQLQMTKDRREDNNNNSQSFLPSSMDSDAIDDTLKSFFPMGISAESDSSAAQFNQSFPLPEMLPSQDLRLSIQSFQDPMLLHHQHNNPQTQHHSSASQDHYHALFSGNTSMGFDVSGWSENQRMLAAWNACEDSTAASGGSDGGGAYMFSLPTTPPFGQNQMFSQRGPLQSSNTPSIRAWMDPTMAAITMAATRDSNQQIQTGIAGFSGFRIPARIQGEEEEHDGFSYKLSSDSLH